MPILVNMPSLDPADVIKAKNDIETLKNDKADKTQLSNPNLLNNPWFTVNQRGLNEFVLDGDTSKFNQYFVDRWQVFGVSNTTATFGTITYNQNVGIKTLTGEGNLGTIGIRQWLDADKINFLRGKKVTLSINVTELLTHADDTTDAGICCFMYSYMADGTEKLLCHIPIRSTGIFHTTFTIPDYEYTRISLAIYFTDYRHGSIAGDYTTVEWVKLELGSVATDFAPPDPASELLKCQRYYEEIPEEYYSSYLYANTSNHRLYIPFKVTKRIPPTLNVTYADGGNNVTTSRASMYGINLESTSGYFLVKKVIANAEIY